MALQNGIHVATRGYHAPLRLQPPLVSFIALFGNVVLSLGAWTNQAGSARLLLPWQRRQAPKKRRSVMRRQDELDNLPSFRNLK